MVDIEISPGKRARTAYSFDDISIVPSRRTREPNEVSTSWQIDAYKFEMPLLAAPMDSVVSPETAIAIGNLEDLAFSTSKVCGLDTRTPRFNSAKFPQFLPTKQRVECRNSIKLRFVPN